MRYPVFLPLCLLLSFSLGSLDAQPTIPADRIYYGASYYPETWPVENVAEDIRRMKELNMNVVRMAEFSWSKMEPAEGAFDFTWLRRIMDQLHANGIAVILGTPTATPPAWLWEKHPEIGVIDEDGKQGYHGARKSYDYGSEIYRHYVVRIVDKMAEALGDHPALIAWQTDNELSAKPDYSDHTRVQFQKWLKKKYGTIESLNDIWATDLWSQRYDDFAQIPLPKSWLWHHPSLQLDWKRFQNDVVVEFQALQLKAIRRHSRHPVTHDTMPGQTTDYEKLFADLDFTAVNNYHSFEAYDRVMSNYDRMRGYKKGMHWLFETAPNNSGGGKQGNTWFLHQPDGSLHAALWMNFALGGQGSLFWLWRQHRAGQEMPHGAIFHSWGKPAANYEDLQKLGADLQKSSAFLLNAPVAPAKIGIFYSHEADTGLRIEEYANGIRYYQDWTYRFYLPLHDHYLHRDVLMPGADIEDYQLLFLPIMPIIPDELRVRLKSWVERGGTLIVGPMSGYRSEYWTSFTDHAMGALNEWSGIEVESRIPIGTKRRPAEIPVFLDFATEQKMESPEASLWSEALSSTAGTVVARYRNGMHDGRPAIIENKVREGKVIVLGADPGRKAMGALLLKYAEELGIEPVLKGEAGLLAVPRMGNRSQGLILDNISPEPHKVYLPKGLFKDILSGKEYADEQLIQPYEVRVLEKVK